MLGRIYSEGVLAPIDNTEAIKWFRMSQQGWASAQLNLGMMIFDGKGVSEDKVEAVKWCQKQQNKGIWKPKFYWEACISKAMGCHKTTVKPRSGRNWLPNRTNRWRSFSSARCTFGTRDTEDHAEAARSFRKSADQGYAEAQYAFAGMYFIGDGVPQDTAEAARLIRAAADQGHLEAQGVLGAMYSDGSGVSVDDTEAVRWLKRRLIVAWLMLNTASARCTGLAGESRWTRPRL